MPSAAETKTKLVELGESCKLHIPAGSAKDAPKSKGSKKSSKRSLHHVLDEELIEQCTRIREAKDVLRFHTIMSSSIPDPCKTASLNREVQLAEETFRIVQTRLVEQRVAPDGVPKLISRAPPVVLLKISLGFSDTAEARFVDAFSSLLEDNSVIAKMITLDAENLTSLADISDRMSVISTDGFPETDEDSNLQEEGLDSLLTFVSSIGNDERPKKRKKKEDLKYPVGLMYFVRRAEHLDMQVLENLINVSRKSRIPAAIVAFYSSVIGPLRVLFPSSRMNVEERSVDGEDSGAAVESSLFEFIFGDDLPFLLGPRVVSFLMRNVYLPSGSTQQLCSALRVAFLTRYTNGCLPIDEDDYSEETSEAFKSLRNSPAFLKYLKTRKHPSQIELLLDDGIFRNFVAESREKLHSLRRDLRLLIKVVTDILTPLDAFRWWDIYEIVLGGKPWKTLPALHSLDRNFEDLDAALRDVQKYLHAQNKHKETRTSLSGALETAVHEYRQNHKSVSEEDTLLKWRKKSREGSPLIALLQEICSHMVPLDSIVYREVFIFDDTSVLANAIMPDIASMHENVLHDPRKLFPADADFGEANDNHDFTIAFNNLIADRRSLNLSKTLSGFAQDSMTDKEKSKKAAEPTPSLRARLLRCLPALQSLGILSLAERGKTRTYTIVKDSIQ